MEDYQAGGDGNGSALTMTPGRVEGYRVFNLFAGSPAHQAGLAVYFDYVVGVDGRRVSRDQAKFFSRVCRKKGQKVKFTVFSSKTQRLRNV